MNRRSFLSLLIATPAALALAPVLARLEPAAPAPPFAPPPLGEPFHLSGCMLGFSRPAVAPGRVELIELMPGELFFPERLVLASLTAQHFDLMNISASGEPIFDETIDAAFFNEVAAPVRFDYREVYPGQRIALALRNRCFEPQPLYGFFAGSVRRPGEPPRYAPWNRPDDWRELEHELDEDPE